MLGESFESHPLRQPFIVVDEAITGTEYHGIKTGCRVSGIHAAKPFYLPAQPVKAGSDVFALPGKFQIQPGPGIHFQGGGKIALAYCQPFRPCCPPDRRQKVFFLHGLPKRHIRQFLLHNSAQDLLLHPLPSELTGQIRPDKGGLFPELFAFKQVISRGKTGGVLLFHGLCPLPDCNTLLRGIQQLYHFGPGLKALAGGKDFRVNACSGLDAAPVRFLQRFQGAFTIQGGHKSASSGVSSIASLAI